MDSFHHKFDQRSILVHIDRLKFSHLLFIFTLSALLSLVGNCYVDVVIIKQLIWSRWRGHFEVANLFKIDFIEGKLAFSALRTVYEDIYTLGNLVFMVENLQFFNLDHSFCKLDDHFLEIPSEFARRPTIVIR